MSTAVPWKNAWSTQAECLSPAVWDAFFPERGGSTLAAKRICERCPVTAECLDWALTHNEQHGVWGGLSDRERDALKRRAS